MQRTIGLLLALAFLVYGLIRIGVGGSLLAQSSGWVDFADLAGGVSEVKLFIEARADQQIFPFTVAAYFIYIMLMGFHLAVGAIGAIVYKRWGYVLLGIYLVLHAALFVNFKEINPKLIVLLLSIGMVVLLYRLRPPNEVHSKSNDVKFKGDN